MFSFFNIMQKTASSKSILTTVELSWDAAKDDDYKEKWDYGVYYGLNAADLLSGMLLVGQLLCLKQKTVIYKKLKICTHN
jgi:hypothetical protein